MGYNKNAAWVFLRITV